MKTFLIYTRDGSKGIKKRNLNFFFGKTLVEHSILFAKKYRYSEIYLSLENKKHLVISCYNQWSYLKRIINGDQNFKLPYTSLITINTINSIN